MLGMDSTTVASTMNITVGALKKAIMAEILDLSRIEQYVNIINSDEKESLDELDETGKAVIHYAAQKGCPEAVDLLIQAGASVNGIGSISPLYCAAKNGDIATVKALLAAGAEVNDCPLTLLTSSQFQAQGLKTKFAFVFTAAQDEEDEGLWTLVIKNNDGSSEPISFPLNPSIHGYMLELLGEINSQNIEIENNNLTIKLKLLKRLPAFLEANFEGDHAPHYVYENKFRPLHVACWQGHVEVVEMLIGAGADFVTPTEQGSTPFSAAVTSALETPNDNITEGVLPTLLEHGARACGADLTNKFYQACSVRGNPKLVEILIEAGIEVNNCPLSLLTVSQFQKQGQTTKFAFIMCDSGTGNQAKNFWILKIDNHDGSFSTLPLLYKHPSHRNTLDILKIINNRNIEEKNFDLPAKLKLLNLLPALLNANFQGDNAPRYVYENKRRPLQIACQLARVETVRILVDNRADVFIPNAEGETPLEAALSIPDNAADSMVNNIVNGVLPILLRRGAGFAIPDLAKRIMNKGWFAKFKNLGLVFVPETGITREHNGFPEAITNTAELLKWFRASDYLDHNFSTKAVLVIMPQSASEQDIQRAINTALAQQKEQDKSNPRTFFTPYVLLYRSCSNGEIYWLLRRYSSPMVYGYNQTLKIYLIPENFPEQEIENLIAEVRAKERLLIIKKANGYHPYFINSTTNKLMTGKINPAKTIEYTDSGKKHIVQIKEFISLLDVIPFDDDNQIIEILSPKSIEYFLVLIKQHGGYTHKETVQRNPEDGTKMQVRINYLESEQIAIGSVYRTVPEFCSLLDEKTLAQVMMQEHQKAMTEKLTEYENKTYPLNIFTRDRNRQPIFTPVGNHLLKLCQQGLIRDPENQELLHFQETLTLLMPNSLANLCCKVIAQQLGQNQADICKQIAEAKTLKGEPIPEKFLAQIYEQATVIPAQQLDQDFVQIIAQLKDLKTYLQDDQNLKTIARIFWGGAKVKHYILPTIGTALLVILIFMFCYWTISNNNVLDPNCRPHWHGRHFHDCKPDSQFKIIFLSVVCTTVISFMGSLCIFSCAVSNDRTPTYDRSMQQLPIVALDTAKQAQLARIIERLNGYQHPDLVPAEVLTRLRDATNIGDLLAAIDPILAIDNIVKKPGHTYSKEALANQQKLSLSVERSGSERRMLRANLSAGDSSTTQPHSFAQNDRHPFWSQTEKPRKKRADYTVVELGEKTSLRHKDHLSNHDQQENPTKLLLSSGSSGESQGYSSDSESSTNSP